MKSILFAIPFAAATLSLSQPMPKPLANQWITRYRAVSPAEPLLTFAGKRSGAVLSIKSLPTPAVLVPTVEHGNVFIRIEKFTVRLGAFSQTCNGNLLPADVLKRINTAPTGSKLRFTDVVCTTGDGSTRSLEAEYTLAQ